MGQWITTYLGPLAIIVGIFASIPIFWTWYDIVFGRKKRQKDIIRQVKEFSGNRPSILIVSIKHDIEALVMHFIAGDIALSALEIPKDRIFKLDRVYLKTEDMPSLFDELHIISANITRAGTDVLHLFIAAPVFFAAMVGAEFANAGFEVNIYHNEPKGSYTNFGPIKPKIIL